MLSIMILICAADVERSACTQRTALTALTALTAPAAASAAWCGLDAQALVASRLQIENGQYVKVLCSRGGGLAIDEARLSAAH